MSAYRDGFGPLEQRRAEVALVRVRVEESAPALHAIYEKRAGRLVGSLVGLVGLAALVPLTFLLGPNLPEKAFVTVWFFATALASVLSGLLVRGGLRLVRTRPSRARRAREAAELLRATDLASIEAKNPWPRLAGLLSALEAPSLVLPLVLASFVLPLTAHAALYLPLAAVARVDGPLSAFSVWISLSAIIVGHAHVALAICAGLFGRKIARLESDELAALPVRKEWWRTLWICVGVASVPGVILLAVPTVLAIVTGLAVMPLMFLVARSVLMRERMVIEAASHDVASVHVGLEDLEEAKGTLAAAAADVAEAPPARVRVAAPEPLPEPTAPAEALDEESDDDAPARRAARR